MAPSLEALRADAEEAARAVRRTQFGERSGLALVDAVPGAGKTTVAVDTASDVAGYGERVAIVTNSNAQSFDVFARVVAARPPGVPVSLLVRESLPLPAEVQSLLGRGVGFVTKPEQLPQGRFIVVGNAAKVASVRQHLRPLVDLLVCDEFFQMSDAQAERVLGIGRRVLGVGDPGQIDPVVTIGVEEWAHLPDGPHRPAPEALAERCAGPGFVRLSLPFTRRLPPDSVPFVASFYPGIAMESLVLPGHRALHLSKGGGDDVDRVLDAMAAGQSVVLAELPPRFTGEHDAEMTEAIAALVERLFVRRARVRVDREFVPLTAAGVMVVAAHNSQQAALSQRLRAGVRVGTANSLQGLEAPVVFGWHPLSGFDRVDAFHADAGRACVMASRHQVALCLVSRAGVPDLLARSLPDSALVPGIAEDPASRGWLAQRTFLRRLGDGRRYHLAP